MTVRPGTENVRHELARIVEAKRAGDPFVDPLSSENLAWWALRWSEEVLALIDAAERAAKVTREISKGHRELPQLEHALKPFLAAGPEAP